MTSNDIIKSTILDFTISSKCQSRKMFTKLFQNNNGMLKCTNTALWCLRKLEKLSLEGRIWSENSKFGRTCMSLCSCHGNVKNYGQTVVTSKCLRRMNEQPLKVWASQSKSSFTIFFKKPHGAGGNPPPPPLTLYVQGLTTSLVQWTYMYGYQKDN